jgi:hypothetical protein
MSKIKVEYSEVFGKRSGGWVREIIGFVKGLGVFLG